VWKPALAFGFELDEVSLPISGIGLQISGIDLHVDGERYYRHPNNTLYRATRVLKLHGLIDWLRYLP
jgi:hypothetical protein